MTMHHLITFLGRKPHSYRSARYTFPDGTELETFFFGHALHQHLSASPCPPTRILILGTDTSMWERLADFLETTEQAMTAVEAIGESATTANLKPLSALLTASMDAQFDLRVVPHGRDRAEQLEILHTLADEVGSGDRVSLDITHGFRHLPTISTLAALYLRRVRAAVISGVYYGALEMTEGGRTPVIRLDGLLEIDEWSEALARHDASGDYGVFAPMLQRDGASKNLGTQVRMAGYLMRSFQVGPAARRLQDVLKRLKEEVAPTSISGLFMGSLMDSMGWARQQGLGAQQLALARAFLVRGDFFRAVSFGLEARITDAVKGRNKLDYRAREAAKVALKERDTGRFRDLNSIRNALIHSNQLSPQSPLRAEVASPDRIELLLRRLLK